MVTCYQGISAYISVYQVSHLRLPALSSIRTGIDGFVVSAEFVNAPPSISRRHPDSRVAPEA